MNRPKKKTPVLSQASKRTKAASKSSRKAAKPAVAEVRSAKRENNHIHAPWKPSLDSYQDLRALHFRTKQHFADASALLWNDELRELPFDLLGNHTILVPAEAVPYFRGLEFTESDLLRPCDLPAEELAELRKQQGPY